jgi:hypothetical protein
MPIGYDAGVILAAPRQGRRRAFRPAFARYRADRSPSQQLSSVGGLVGDLQALAGARPAPNAPMPAEDHDRLTRVLDQYLALLQASAESAIVLSQRPGGRLRVGRASPLFYEATRAWLSRALA